MSRLGLGLGLTKGGIPPFNPLSLDPYLLFDTQSSMIGTFENPTLDLDPSDPDTLDVITATRSGTATYTDADGVIREAASDTVRVDYTQGEELTPTKYQRVGYTDFSVFAYPYGWHSAGTVVEGEGYGGQPSVVFTAQSSYQFIAIGMPTKAGVTYTGSIWVRRITGNESLVVQHSTSATGTNSGTLNVTTEWTKIEVQFLGNASSGNVFFGIKVASANAAGTSFEIAMPQVEEGTTATDFVANTTGSPKFIASATYGDRVPMILVEPSATNLVPDSNTFNKASAVVRLGTDFEGPDGTNTAEGYGSIPATNGEKVYSQAASISPNTEYVCSVWVKGEAGKTTSFFAKRSGGTYVSSNIVTVTLTGGWQRVTGMVMTTLSDNTGITINLLGSASATQADEVYLWGAQVETGSVSTSVIPTSGSTVTRQADNLVISGSDFTDFFNNSEGTIYCEFEYDFEPAYEYIYNIRQDATNEIRTQLIPTNNIRTRYTVAGSHVAQPSPSGVVQGSLNRYAFSYKTNNFRGNVNGGNDEADLLGNTDLTPVRMKLGGRDSVLETTKFKRLIYWPYHSDRL